MISHRLFKRGWIQMYHLKGCGVDLLPRIHISMSFSEPEFEFSWWSFHLNITIHRRCPNWFMKYVWGLLVNFDWPFTKEEHEE